MRSGLVGTVFLHVALIAWEDLVFSGLDLSLIWPHNSFRQKDPITTKLVFNLSMNNLFDIYELLHLPSTRPFSENNIFIYKTTEPMGTVLTLSNGPQKPWPNQRDCFHYRWYHERNAVGPHTRTRMSPKLRSRRDRGKRSRLIIYSRANNSVHIAAAAAGHEHHFIHREPRKRCRFHKHRMQTFSGLGLSTLCKHGNQNKDWLIQNWLMSRKCFVS